MRERLRKKLRRSPEPEEISFEMARNKGFGGRSKRNKPMDNIMHGTGNVSSDVRGEILSQTSREPQEEPHRYLPNVGELSPAVGLQTHEGSPRNVTLVPNTSIPSKVLTISDEDIVRHPMVLKMMQRLEALEGRTSQVSVEKQAARAENNTADEISEANPGEDDLVEQDLPAENPVATEVHIFFRISI